ncbi:hypothetical protein [Pelagibacterium sp. H642]|uniref:hypothetical protein n=1 Tax=Pelagibacterium sp. H642 TaxID=1881069 RepID=UPI002814E683|nr:hypothetical protein [Pelagibacterium sp. H642]WMT90149.1 hypothetical protein NO934_15325 [Pelagibacterium sp. H642]
MEGDVPQQGTSVEEMLEKYRETTTTVRFIEIQNGAQNPSQSVFPGLREALQAVIDDGGRRLHTLVVHDSPDDRVLTHQELTGLVDVLIQSDGSG